MKKMWIIGAVFALLFEPSFGLIEKNVSADLSVTFEESLPLPVVNAINIFTKRVQKRTSPIMANKNKTKRFLYISVNEALVPPGLSNEALKKDGYYPATGPNFRTIAKRRVGVLLQRQRYWH